MGASNIEKATVEVQAKTEPVPEKKAFTEAEKSACSIDAMMNGGTCEACQ
jgi:ribonucleoside-diphosphate reductase alpha chain